MLWQTYKIENTHERKIETKREERKRNIYAHSRTSDALMNVHIDSARWRVLELWLSMKVFKENINKSTYLGQRSLWNYKVYFVWHQNHFHFLERFSMTWFPSVTVTWWLFLSFLLFYFKKNYLLHTELCLKREFLATLHTNTPCDHEKVDGVRI